jgi:hypothetical protein
MKPTSPASVEATSLRRKPLLENLINRGFLRTPASPYRVLPRTDGRWIVIDDRLPVGAKTVDVVATQEVAEDLADARAQIEAASPASGRRCSVNPYRENSLTGVSGTPTPLQRSDGLQPGTGGLEDASRAPGEHVETASDVREDAESCLVPRNTAFLADSRVDASERARHDRMTHVVTTADVDRSRVRATSDAPTVERDVANATTVKCGGATDKDERTPGPACGPANRQSLADDARGGTFAGPPPRALRGAPRGTEP